MKDVAGDEMLRGAASKRYHPGFQRSTERDDGGDEGTRTPDPLLAKEVLSQLSYIPTAPLQC